MKWLGSLLDIKELCDGLFNQGINTVISYFKVS